MAENKQKIISDMKRVFAEGDNKIVLSKNKEIILVLGNSGSGKSTFVQLLAGDNDKLIAKETGGGLGTYWIYDENDKISKDDTMLSKTIFPDLVVDPNSNNAFYDCPGFNDNRNASIDIGGTYFIRKVINHAEAVKIILLINYDSIKVAINRIDLPNLLTHATNLIKNVDKYKKSILLVASKVETEPAYNELTDDYDDIEDHEVVEGIVTFLKNAKTTYKDKVTSSQSEKDKKTNLDSIKLLDVFLQQQGKSYTNIGLFRKANMEGKVSTIPLLQENKQNLNNLINNNLTYTRTSDTDFGYTISAPSQLVISDIVNYINSELSETVTGIAKEITNFYYNKEKNIRDIYELKSQLNSAKTNVNKIMIKIRGKENPKYIIEDIIKGLEELNIENTKTSDIKNIANQYDHLEFLQKLANKKLMFTKKEIIEPFEKAFKNVEQSANWYEFFTNFYEKLFSYDAQQYTGKYNKFVEKVNEWKRKKSNVFGFDIKENIKDIITKVRGFPSIERLQLDELKLNVVSDIVESAFKNNLNTTCVGDRLEIRGTWIKTSDLKNYEDNYFYKVCHRIVASVEVFALREFVVDSDYDLRNQKIKLTIIAPTWRIMRDYSRINLSGNDGYTQSKVKPNPTHPGEKGYPGSPGRQGTSGGNFFGVGKKFIGGYKLTVAANGGKGGDGQEGSDGAPGRKGDKNKCTWYDETFVYGIWCNVTVPETAEVVGNSWRDDWGIQYRLRGDPGGMGGQGGDGGAFGYPGKRGSIQIYELEGKANFKTVSYNGSEGRNGKGGNPGAPGQEGDLCEAYYYVKFLRRYWHEIYCDLPSEKFAEPNIKGEDGKNTKGRLSPDTQTPEIDKSAMINKYKKFIKENFNDRFNYKQYPAFYRELERIPQTQRNDIDTDQVRERRNILTNNSVSRHIDTPNLIDSEEHIDNNEEYTRNLNSTGFTLNNTLLLVDFVIRKLTGSKPVNNNSYVRKENSLNILAESLNMVEKFENMLTKFLKSENISKSSVTIDFSNLVGKIQAELTNDYNVKKISKILYNSVIHEIRDNKISNKFMKVITKMVTDNMERTFNPKITKNENQFHELYINNIESKNDVELLGQHNVPLIN